MSCTLVQLLYYTILILSTKMDGFILTVAGVGQKRAYSIYYRSYYGYILYYYITSVNHTHNIMYILGRIVLYHTTYIYII